MTVCDYSKRIGSIGNGMILPEAELACLLGLHLNLGLSITGHMLSGCCSNIQTLW